MAAEHDDGERQDRGGEDLLTNALEGIGKGVGKSGNQTGAHEPGPDTATDPDTSSRHAGGGGKHDPDDQSCL